MEPIRILQVIGAMNRAGAETFIMNMYRCMDPRAIQFDFLVNETSPCDYDAEIRERGGRIYAIPRYNIANRHSYTRAVQKFFAEHREHAVVHGHIGLPGAIYLREAKKAGVFTIAHSHNTDATLTPASLVYKISTLPIRHIADYFLACSQQAGVDRFGEKVANSPNFQVLLNGIDVKAYAFSQDARKRIREKLSLSNDSVFIHVGRLTKQKNHSFLLTVFKEVLQQLPQAKLLLVGAGELEADLRAQAESHGISSSIKFLGVRSDVSELLSAADVFVFPSIYEGLPVAVIEAQATGIACLCSDVLPSEAQCSSALYTLGLDAGVHEWTQRLLELYKASDTNDRLAANTGVRQAGFDSSETAVRLSELYERAALSH